MDDRELEALLNKYRPGDPPASLENHLFPSTHPRAWPWAVAATVLLAITLGLQVGRRDAPAIDPIVQAAAQDLAEISGGDQQSRAMAEWTLTIAQRLSEEREQRAVPR